MIDTDKYEGHLASEGQTWAWSKWMLKNAETIQQHEATAALLKDAPLLFAEVKRLREEKTFLWETYLKESAEVKRLREDIQVAIEDIEDITECTDTQEFIEGLLDYLKGMIQ